MSPIVLVPGACLGAWALRRIDGALRERGHAVHALTLTGFGDRAHLGGPHVDLSLHARDVAAHLEREELEDVVLVGHSYAGAVVRAAAELVPQRIARLVSLDGVVLRPGRSIFDDGPEGMDASMQQLADAHGDGWAVPFMSRELLDTYFGDHGIGDEDYAWLARHAAPFPLAVQRERLALDDPRAAALPVTYVVCTRRAAPAPELPADWERVELDAGHWPIVTAPAATVQALDRIAQA